MSTSVHEPPHLDRFVWGIIRRKVRGLMGRCGFTKQDREDLKQELVLRLLQAMPSFDPNQGHWNVFVTTVIERAAGKIKRHRRAQKRQFDKECSLEALLEETDEEQTEILQQTEPEVRRELAARDLQIDMAEFLATLPDDLRDLAERLQWKCLSEVARELRLPRTTLQRRFDRLRQRFLEAGWETLEESCVNFRANGKDQ